MEIEGVLQNGVVVLRTDSIPPDGTVVVVSVVSRSDQKECADKHHVQLPLVRSNRPGQLKLTNEQIAEILDREDVSG